MFEKLFYIPLLNLLFLIYNFTVADIGIAIIILTLLIRIILLPIFYKSAKDQAILQKISPRIRELQKLHKDNKEKQIEEILKIYRQHKVNPFSGFLLIFIQLPVLIALYKIFVSGFNSNVLSHLYSFVKVPSDVNMNFLSTVNLSTTNIWLTLLAVFVQYLQSKEMFKTSHKPSKEEKGMVVTWKISKSMTLFGPILSLAILYSLPSAVSLYWLVTSFFSFIQQILINKRINSLEL